MVKVRYPGAFVQFIVAHGKFAENFCRQRFIGFVPAVLLLVDQALPAGDVPQVANPIAPQDIIGGAVEVRNPDLPDFLLHKY